MRLLENFLAQEAVFYVSRDIERAVGLPQPGLIFIISNLTEYSKKIATGQEDILLIDEGRVLDTWELLEHPQTKKFINNNIHRVKTNLTPPPLLPGEGSPMILVFKNTTEIEKICDQNNWQLLNPSATLSKQVEEKISQVEWLGELIKFLPPHQIDAAKNISFDGAPFILQFNRAHTGLGTMKIENEKQLQEIQKKFPNRPARVTKFIDGPMFTSNNIATKDKILVGNISYQITGLSPFTTNKFSTIGNDWALPHKLLTTKQKQKYTEMVQAIGNKLHISGWKGLFGVDIILDQKSGELFLIEINARQPASTTFESMLQIGLETLSLMDAEFTSFIKPQPTHTMTIFEAHLAALCNIPSNTYKLIEIHEGAQIIQRVTERILTNPHRRKTLIWRLRETEPWMAVPYQNTKLGADWIRLQFLSTGLMENHGVFNEKGLKIQKILETQS